MDPTKYIKLKNETLLFFVEKLIEIELEANKKCRTLHDLSCQFGSKGFTKEMRQIAGGSQSGLKKFLSEYPSLFEIHSGDLVSYRETVQNPINNNQEVVETPEKNDAVEYFRERMIDYGLGVWVPVKSLLGHRSQAPTQVRHVSGQHYEEFLTFLGKHPETFKLNQDAVILTEFEPKSSDSNRYENREHVLNLIQFYGGVLKERGPMLVEQLFHASAAHDSAKELKSPNDLKSFFQMHAECFVVSSSLVTLSDSYQVGFEYLQNLQQKSLPIPATEKISIEITKKPSVPLPIPTPGLPVATAPNPAQQPTLKTRVSAILLKTLENNERKPAIRKTCSLDYNDNLTEEELKNYLISRTEIVSNVRKAKEICKNFLTEKSIAVDLEGVNLGDENGTITLLQVSCRGDIFLFDVLTSRGVLEEVRGVLEGSSVVKVLHDCRNDSSSLYKEFGILLRNVFDTSAANVVLDKKTSKNASLNGLATNYKVLGNPFKDRVKSLYRHDSRFWSRRPLTKQMIVYAAADVLVLEKLHEKMSPLIESSPEMVGQFQELVEEQILTCIHPDEIRQRRKMRKNEKDLEELKVKIEAGFHAGEVGVLSNRELRLLKHLTLPEAIKNSLKSSLKIAKKLEKLEKRDNEGGQNSTSSSEFTSLEIMPAPSETNGEKLGDFYPQNNFVKVEALLSGLSDIVGVGGGVNEKVEQGTQTTSTGDIVVMRVFEEEVEP